MKKLSPQGQAYVDAFLKSPTAYNPYPDMGYKSFYGMTHAKKNGAIVMPFTTPQLLAKDLKVSLKTLERMRKRGEGPPWMKVGKAIRYPMKKLDAWIAEQLGDDLPTDTS